MEYLVTALREHQELTIFLTLAVGFTIGRFRFGSFSLGTVVGTLLAGVVIGQLKIKVDPVVKNVFFDLFLFTIGYKVGPQFFRGLKKDALPQLAITVVLCVTCLICAVVAAYLLGFDMGTAAGMLAGAFTESTVIGTAGDAINRLAIPDAEKAVFINNIPIAYAVTYLIGTAFIVWFYPNVAPRLMGVNLKEEARKLQASVGGGAQAEAGVMSALQRFTVRAYRVTSERLLNQPIAAIEALPVEHRVFITRIRHDNVVAETLPDTIVRAGDVVAVTTRTNLLADFGTRIGPEVHDAELLDFPVEILDVVVTNNAIVGKTLGELAALESTRGVFLRKIVRVGELMPFTADTRLDRGDVLNVVGAKVHVERVAREFGYADRASIATDMVFVGLGIVLGGLIGLLTVTVGSLPLTLTASGGALMMGLVFGWLRAVRPTFGRIPEAAMWVFETVGLTVFIAVVGLGAGPSFVEGLRTSGMGLVLVGFIVAAVPHITAILFGRFILRMNPIILVGACCGAGTITAALRAVQEEAQSPLPALGYTVPYALGNILLTAWGPVIVALMR